MNKTSSTIYFQISRKAAAAALLSDTESEIYLTINDLSIFSYKLRTRKCRIFYCEIAGLMCGKLKKRHFLSHILNKNLSFDVASEHNYINHTYKGLGRATGWPEVIRLLIHKMRNRKKRDFIF